MLYLKNKSFLWLVVLSFVGVLFSARPMSAAPTFTHSFAENPDNSSGTLTVTVTSHTGNVSYAFSQAPSSPVIGGLPTTIGPTATTAETIPISFSAANNYTVAITVTDTSGSSGPTDQAVNIAQVATTGTASPTPVELKEGGTQTFTATFKDQFGNAIAAPGTVWSVVGAPSNGTIVPGTGAYTAPSAAVVATIKATPNTGTVVPTATANVYAPPSPTLTFVTPLDSTGTTGTLKGVNANPIPTGGLTYAYANVTDTGGAVLIPTVTHSGITAATDTATVTYTATGNYGFTLTITDSLGQSTTTTPSPTVTETVPQYAKAGAISPLSVDLPEDGTKTFTVSFKDQFGGTIATPNTQWTVTGGGTIGLTTGNYTAPSSAATATITANPGPAIAQSSLYVAPIATSHVYAPPVITNLSGNLQADGIGCTLTASLGSPVAPGTLIYLYTCVSYPAGASNPIPGGITRSSMLTTDTTPTFQFPEIGTYTFQVIVTDSLGQTSNTGVAAVVVSQIATAISISPTSATVAINGQQLFTATVTDQFENSVPTPTVNWSVVMGGVGSIDGGGNYSAGPNPGTATVKATSGAANATASVTVSDSAPTVGTITASPTPVTGKTATLTVTGNYTGSGNLTYTWSQMSVPMGGSVTFNPTPIIAAPGVPVNTTATFTEAGMYVVKVAVTDGSNSSVTTTLSIMVDQTVTAITVAPTTPVVIVNKTDAFTATAFDQFGNTLSTQPAFTWSASISGGGIGGGTVDSSGNYTAPKTIANDSTTNTETDIVTASVSGVAGSASVTIDPDVSKGLTYTKFPSAIAPSTSIVTVAGVPFVVAVQAVDQYGNNVLNGTSIDLALLQNMKIVSGTGQNAPQLNSPKQTTNGIATFSVAVFEESTTSGDYTIQATVADSGSALMDSTAFTVYSAAPYTLMLTGPANVTAGTSVSLTASVLDQYGNIVGLLPEGPSYAPVTITFSASDPNATPPSTTTFGSGTTYSTAVTATFVTVTSPAQSLTADAASLFPSTYKPTVAPGATTHFVVTSSLITAMAGAQLKITFIAEDQYGNVVTSYAGSPNVSSTDPKAILSGPFTANSGKGSFGAQLFTAGNIIITVTDSKTIPGTTITGSTTILVSPTGLNHFVFVQPPTAATSATPLTLVVEAVDVQGNPTSIPTNDLVTITGTDKYQTFKPTSLPPIAFNNGMAAFTTTFATPGNQTVTVTDELKPSITSSIVLAITDPKPSISAIAAESTAQMIANPTSVPLTVTSLPAGSSVATLVINGAGFEPRTPLDSGTAVSFDGTPIVDTFDKFNQPVTTVAVSETQIVITNYPFTQAAGSYNFTIENNDNAAQGAPFPFQLTNLLNINPSSVIVGDPGFTSLQIFGPGLPQSDFLSKTDNFIGSVTIVPKISSPGSLITALQDQAQPSSILYLGTTLITATLPTPGAPVSTAPTLLSYGAAPVAGNYVVSVSDPNTVVNSTMATFPLTVTPLTPADVTNQPDLNPFQSGQSINLNFQFFSVPFDYAPDVSNTNSPSITDILNVLDTKSYNPISATPLPFAVWDPTTAQYLTTTESSAGQSPADSTIDPSHLFIGKGYWTRIKPFPLPFGSLVALRERGRDATAVSMTPAIKGVNLFYGYDPLTLAFAIPLHEGWNMIGNPFNNTVSLANFTVLTEAKGAGRVSLANANIQVIASDVLYRYSNAPGTKTGAQYVAVSSRSLSGDPVSAFTDVQENVMYPYIGYWVLAYQDCTLYVSSN